MSHVPQGNVSSSSGSASSLPDAARQGAAAQRGPLEAEDGRSLGAVLGDVTSNLSTLMRQEVALAKVEAKQEGAQAGKGIGMYAGAAVAGVLFLVFVSLCLMWALDAVMHIALAALIVALIWAIVAAILASVGKKEFERLRGLRQTSDSLSKIPNALKGREEDNR